MVIAKAPGTCGEYLQGIYNERPALISSPVDMFSTTIIRPGSGKRVWKEKGQRAYELFLEKFHIDKEKGQTIDIEVSSELPVEKGMASSTADILSVLYALSAYFNIKLSEEQAAQIAIMIEPSDNTMFESLNLFDFYNGEILEELGKRISGKILILDFKDKVNTEDFGYETEFKKSVKKGKEALKLFKMGLEENRFDLIAQATTLSAENNQTALKHPYFERIKDLAQRKYGLGVMIGHSGSVIGIPYDEQFNKIEFLKELKDEIPDDALEAIYDRHLISGGVRIEEIFE